MSKEKPDDLTDIERLRHWMEAVGGNIFLGLSALKSIEESKDGDKLTIVLKKNSERKMPTGLKGEKRPAVGAFRHRQTPHEECAPPDL